MTLNDIIISALAQLDRDHSSQTMDVWRAKMTRFANEAVLDLAGYAALRRTDQAQVTDGVVDVNTLPKQCVKVISLWRNGKKVPFVTGPATNEISPSCEDGSIKVLYRWLPGEMSSPTDVPELPEWCHGLIVTYCVARERSTADPSMQRGANVFFELYQDGKRRLRRNLGEPDTYKIINKGW